MHFDIQCEMLPRDIPDGSKRFPTWRRGNEVLTHIVIVSISYSSVLPVMMIAITFGPAAGSSGLGASG